MIERNEAPSSVNTADNVYLPNLYIFHKCVYYQSNNTNHTTKLLEFGMQTCTELIASLPTSHWPAYFHFVFLHGGEKKTPGKKTMNFTDIFFLPEMPTFYICNCFRGGNTCKLPVFCEVKMGF